MSKDRKTKNHVSEELYKQLIFEIAIELTEDNIKETQNRLLDLINDYNINRGKP